MAVTTNILRSYVAPRLVLRRLIASTSVDDRPEARGFIYLLVGFFLLFVGQIPDLMGIGINGFEVSDEAFGEDGRPSVQQSLMITLFFTLTVWPIVFYLIGGLSHVIAKLVGGQGEAAHARLALFWAVLAVSPLFLLRGIGSVSQVPALVQTCNWAIVLAFFWIWLMGLYEAERANA